jgi:hypothetical protein
MKSGTVATIAVAPVEWLETRLLKRLVAGESNVSRPSGAAFEHGFSNGDYSE